MPKKQQNSEKSDQRKFMLSDTPTSFTNNVRIAGTSDRSSILIQLISDLPDEISVENHRTTVDYLTAEFIIDTLSEVTGYYPKKKKTPQKKTAKSTK